VGAHEVGLTATVLQPSDFALLLEARIGLTDLAEYVAGAALPDDALYAAQLRDVIQAIQPRALAFNGKNTASLFYRGGTHRLSYGRYDGTSAGRSTHTCSIGRVTTNSRNSRVPATKPEGRKRTPMGGRGRILGCVSGWRELRKFQPMTAPRFLIGGRRFIPRCTHLSLKPHQTVLLNNRFA
jgi:hypothetical protein